MAFASKAALLAVTLAALGAGGVAAWTGRDAAPSAGAIGRYQMLSIGSNLIRLDTATGEMVGCLFSRESWPGVACAVTADALASRAGAIRAQATITGVAAELAREDSSRR